jgi:hypothetical protein
MERIPQASPNVFSELQGTIWSYDTGGSTGILYSLDASPGTLTYSPDQIQGPADTNPKAAKSSNAIALLTYPGIWYFFAAVVGSSAAKENYCFLPCPPEAMKLLLELQGKVVGVGDVNVTHWGGTAVTAASNFDSDADVTKTKVGPTINSRLAAYSTGDADWVKLSTYSPSGITGEGHGAQYWARVASALFGRDTGDSTMRAIEARGALTAQARTLYRLLTDSIARYYDVIQDTYIGQAGLEETSGLGAGFPAAMVARESQYFSSRRGRRFAVTSEGTAITVSNGFTATAPRMTIEAGATSELIIRKITLSVLVAGTTNLQVRIVLDPDARYSSGGTAVTLGARTNLNGGNSTAADFTAHYGAITATATDADEREVFYGTIVNVTGNERIIEWEDGLIVPASGTLLIYLMDAGAAGTIAANVNLEEANVQ